MMKRSSRRRFVVYEKDYTPNNGKKFVTCYSWWQALKQAKKFGIGCQVDVHRYQLSKDKKNMKISTERTIIYQ